MINNLIIRNILILWSGKIGHFVLITPKTYTTYIAVLSHCTEYSYTCTRTVQLNYRYVQAATDRRY